MCLRTSCSKLGQLASLEPMETAMPTAARDWGEGMGVRKRGKTKEGGAQRGGQIQKRILFLLVLFLHRGGVIKAKSCSRLPDSEVLQLCPFLQS